jgi:glycosyltransferase involved in cell wall biosynthesis
VTAVSRWLADEAKAIVNTRRPVVAPMPVATEYFSPGGTRASDRLLFVGRLNQQKGIATLIEAMGKAKASFSLDVIGDGADKDALVARAAALGLGDRIRWHAGMRQPKLAEFYRNATALVVPSVDEGLGLVAVEAQLCETPVVAFTSGGLTDVVQHDRTGILVGELTADGLARAIDDLFARADRGVSMGAAGRLSALSTFAPESAARRYADIYRAVATGAPSE